ncbi:MAG: HlyU family transcriptional regulator [Alphaproteobacteria bacterium]
MASIFSRLFGGGSGSKAGGSEGGRGDPVEYQGLVIRATPERAGGQWRLSGVIIKPDETGDLERSFLRSDLFSSREDAESFAITKARQIIDERGQSLFADGAKTGRA